MSVSGQVAPGARLCAWSAHVHTHTHTHMCARHVYIVCLCMHTSWQKKSLFLSLAVVSWSIFISRSSVVLFLLVRVILFLYILWFFFYLWFEWFYFLYRECGFIFISGYVILYLYNREGDSMFISRSRVILCAPVSLVSVWFVFIPRTSVCSYVALG